MPDAVIPLCGSGTSGCHHLFDNYASIRGEMREAGKLTSAEWAYIIRTVGQGKADWRYPPPVETVGKAVDNS